MGCGYSIGGSSKAGPCLDEEAQSDDDDDDPVGFIITPWDGGALSTGASWDSFEGL